MTMAYIYGGKSILLRPRKLTYFFLFSFFRDFIGLTGFEIKDYLQDAKSITKVS